MVSTLKEIRDRVKNDTRETGLSDTWVSDYVNLTLQEINDPGWAYEQIGMKGYDHEWTFNRRKHSITTVASTENYQLPRDLDKVGLIRQTSSPQKLLYVPDELFYEFIPNPTATGNPQYYRIWEEEGVSTRLSTDDKIKVVSSSSSDTTIKISIVGYNDSGYLQSEELTLTGTTAVSGTLTYDAGRPLRISKSATSVGYVTVTEYTAGTTLVILAIEERTTRFKVAGFYPIPSSAISLYLEYYTRIRNLVNDSDVPDIDEKWIWVVRIGVMAKIYQYQGKESMFSSAQNMFGSGVRSMVKADLQNIDYIPILRSQMYSRGKTGRVTFSDLGYGSYGLNY